MNKKEDFKVAEYAYIAKHPEKSDEDLAKEIDRSPSDIKQMRWNIIIGKKYALRKEAKKE